MKNLSESIAEAFGHKLRVRVSGICIENNKVLLVKHHSLGEKGILWAPPGGGILFGESAEDSLKREFMEETNLEIEVSRFLFVHEFIASPLHAIELFFEVKAVIGQISIGRDPELKENKQIIHDLKFFSYKEIEAQDINTFHNIFALSSDINSLLNMNGYYKYEKSENKAKKN